MKFGVREICDVVLRAKAKMQVGDRIFYKNEPVLYFDSLTTSSLEGAATTVYATGGRGNARLMAWEGERTLTFNMTDALISAESFMILSGAGLIEAHAADAANNIEEQALYVHTTSKAIVQEVTDPADNTKTIYVIDVPDRAAWNHKGEILNTNTATPTDAGVRIGKDYYNAGADIFIMALDNGEVNGVPAIPYDNGVKHRVKTEANGAKTNLTRIECYAYAPGTTVLVDYYIKRTSSVKQIEITPDKFGGYFYLEASTLFREEATGRDLPAEFIIPRCKIQSNFTFTMASTGDPSTFDFVLDAFPDYTKFDSTKEVLAVLQVVEEEADEDNSDLEQREHAKKREISAVNTEDAEHKNQYDFGGANYAFTNDTIASETFRTHDPEDDD